MNTQGYFGAMGLGNPQRRAVHGVAEALLSTVTILVTTQHTQHREEL
jgi:hypothetical protein